MRSTGPGQRVSAGYKKNVLPLLAHDFQEYMAMGWLVQPLLFFLARCTRNQLIWNIEFLKTENEVLRKRYVSCDNDQIYKQAFDRVLTEAGARPPRLAIRAPNTNAYVERFIKSIQVECLDHFLVIGERHLDYPVRQYVEHFHKERPHQGLGNRLRSR
jgi:Integrase core domain